jgi:hypothetical protein
LSEIRGNKAVENAAVAWVIELERAAGRHPVDTRHIATAPGDIESPPRTIEVKAAGRSSRGSDLWLETRQVDAARQDSNFYVYLVENVLQGDPTRFSLKVLGGELLARLLSRAKEQRYYTVPLPVKEYDTAPGLSEVMDGPRTEA